MTIQEFQKLARDLRIRAKNVRYSKNDRARALAYEAGLDGSLLGIHPHNAMVAFHSGQPWPDVDYAKVRKVLWILEHEFDADRIVDRILEKAMLRIQCE